MWFNVLNIVGWLKGGTETPVSETDRLPVDTGLNGLATADKQLPDNHRVQVSNLPAIQEVSGTVSLDAASLIALENVTVNVEAGASVGVNNLPATYPLPPGQVQIDALTDAQLRASPVGVRDSFASGEVLPDQVGAGNVLIFTFTQPVDSFWVAVEGLMGTVKVDPYGGMPSATQGIPVSAGTSLPIPQRVATIRAFVPDGLRVTVYGDRY